MSRALDVLGFTEAAACADGDRVAEAHGTLGLVVLAAAVALDVLTLPLAAAAALGGDE